MEERKTAAIVLLILALIAFFFFGFLPYIDKEKTHTLSYSGCRIDFKYDDNVDTTDKGYILAQNDLGLCLCNGYEKKHDTAVAGQIMKIYKRYGTSISPDTINKAHYNNLDSILKYKSKAFTDMIAED